MRRGRVAWGAMLALVGLATARSPVLVSYSAPEFLTFKDLLSLADTPKPDGNLDLDLQRILSTPFLSNEAWNRGSRPNRPIHEGFGPVIRACQWNIEGGVQLRLIRLALTDPAAFEAEVVNGKPIEPDALQAIRTQLELLREADVVVLNEVDLGMRRTGYRDVARELAQALHMNYAYGVEFVEVDKLVMGQEQYELEDAGLRAKLKDALEVDPLRYKGLQGSAILSRYPIRSARIHRLIQCYDWYGKEKEAIAELEKGRRLAASRVFLERISRELRHGNRIALIADLEVPESPTGLVTVVTPHLENKCPPECRRAQMADTLLDIRGIANPLILAGDLNTTGHSAAPTSIRLELAKRLNDPEFWIRQVLFRFAGPTAIPQALLLPANYFKNFRDPTARDIVLFGRNPESDLFRTLERFRFNDGFAFDFRGNLAEADGQNKTLANSNERAAKGFRPTYEFARDYGGLVGTFKLDWFLIKPSIRHPRKLSGSYHLAPVYARTLSELNRALPDRRLSDHDPIIVDLALKPPPLGQGRP